MEISHDLIKEHVRILQGLEYLSMARHALEKNLHPPKEFFETAVLFFREYADKFHHKGGISHVQFPGQEKRGID